nr:hyp [Cotesia vestalis bracovirus]
MTLEPVLIKMTTLLYSFLAYFQDQMCRAA